MKFNLKHIITAATFIIGMSSCDYLNIVPDNTIELETMFETQEQAYGALSTCYEYMPNWGWLNNSMSLAGDEFIVRLDGGESGNPDRMPGEKLMKGWNSAQNPYLCYWNGGKNASALYVGIRYCNLFLENIDKVKDITDEDRKDWIAQVKILKAYYHFIWLVCMDPFVLLIKI